MFQVQIGPGDEVKFRGRLDAAEADQALADLGRLDRSTVADCSELEYISSAGISVLVLTYKRLHGAGHTFKLANVTPRVRNVFTYAGLAPLLGIE